MTLFNINFETKFTMNIFEWLTIFSICLIGAATPGPSLIIILYITNTKGLLAGIIN